MPKTIQLSDDRYERLVSSARAQGYNIQAGAGSQMGEYIEWLLDNANPPAIHGATTGEVWGRFFARVSPHIGELAQALAGHGTTINQEFSAKNGVLIVAESGQKYDTIKSGGIMKTEYQLTNEDKKTIALYDRARRRVENSPRLKPHIGFIMADWPEGDEHWRWVASAKISEILDWAEAGSQ